MPFEDTEFKFPDEIESKGKPAQEAPEIEIEIEDDRPEEDRVDPLPQSVKEELYDDELTDYSAIFLDKTNKLTSSSARFCAYFTRSSIFFISKWILLVFFLTNSTLSRTY